MGNQSSTLQLDRREPRGHLGLQQGCHRSIFQPTAGDGQCSRFSAPPGGAGGWQPEPDNGAESFQSRRVLCSFPLSIVTVQSYWPRHGQGFHCLNPDTYHQYGKLFAMKLMTKHSAFQERLMALPLFANQRGSTELVPDVFNDWDLILHHWNHLIPNAWLETFWTVNPIQSYQYPLRIFRYGYIDI